MMKPPLFVTGNKRKVWQAEATLEQYGITIVARDLDIREIQSPDPLEISLAKARSAFDLVREPLLICDHSWAIPALKGFPGGYMKDINHWFGPEDFLALMHGKQDRSILLTETVVYIEEDLVQEFSVEFQGKIINESRGQGHFPQERVVIFDGQTQTIAEAIDKNENARDMSKSAWPQFAKWYKTH